MSGGGRFRRGIAARRTRGSQSALQPQAGVQPPALERGHADRKQVGTPQRVQLRERAHRQPVVKQPAVRVEPRGAQQCPSRRRVTAAAGVDRRGWPRLRGQLAKQRGHSTSLDERAIAPRALAADGCDDEPEVVGERRVSLCPVERGNDALAQATAGKS